MPNGGECGCLLVSHQALYSLNYLRHIYLHHIPSRADPGGILQFLLGRFPQLRRGQFRKRIPMEAIPLCSGAQPSQPLTLTSWGDMSDFKVAKSPLSAALHRRVVPNQGPVPNIDENMKKMTKQWARLVLNLILFMC